MSQTQQRLQSEKAHMLGITPRELLGNELHKPRELRLLAPNEVVQELLLRQNILCDLLHTSTLHVNLSWSKLMLSRISTSNLATRHAFLS